MILSAKMSANLRTCSADFGCALARAHPWTFERCSRSEKNERALWAPLKWAWPALTKAKALPEITEQKKKIALIFPLSIDPLLLKYLKNPFNKAILSTRICFWNFKTIFIKKHIFVMNQYVSRILKWIQN